MTQSQMLEFLKKGALLRLPSGKVRLWSGDLSPTDLSKDPVFSIAYMDFFSSNPEGFLSSRPVLETEVSELRRQLQGFVDAQAEINHFSQSSFQEPVRELFQDSFQAIQGKIHRGEIEKAVPVVFAKSSERPSVTDLARILFHALETHAELYVFGFWNEEQGIVGATPEVLFHLKDKHLKTMALAGTCPKNEQSSRQSLLKDPKELKEHRLVVEDIQKRLEKLGWVKTGPTEILELPTLFHLRTLIEVEISQTSTVDALMKHLHPTAALGVFPRNYGIQWLKTLPYQEERGLFGAPIVFSISHSECLALVAIRCLQWTEQGSHVGSGCGIVQNSELQREWNELTAKRDSVFKILGLSR